jgi:hypothetical protein
MSRKIRSLFTSFVVLFTTAIVLLLIPFSQKVVEAEQSVAKAQPTDIPQTTTPAQTQAPIPAQPASTATVPATPASSAPATTAAVPPGTEVHVTRKGESLPGLVHTYLPKTKYMTGSELEAAIRAANPPMKTIWFKPDQQVLIPGVLPPDYAAHSVPVPKNFEVRAIYMTGTMAGSAKGLELMRQWRALGGNSVVFDVKDSDGIVNVPFQHPLSNDKYIPIRNLPKLVNYIHSLDMHAISRIAIFRDEYLVQHHPELAVRSRKTGQAWRENGKLVWTDPSNPAIQEYNIALAKYAAKSGVDEVQFDYVRFPAEGDQKDAQFSFEAKHPQWSRADVIADFLKSAHGELKPMNVLFSLDVFGVMAWQRPVDLSHTGQDIVRMAQHCDVLSPMIYPSHFFGMDGYKDPGDAPEHFISESMERFKLITKDSGVVLRPWLQAFGWRTKSYSPDYIRTQVVVAKDNGGIGFLFWNARNDYSKPFTAMPEMKSPAGKYFRGDDVGTTKPPQPVKPAMTGSTASLGKAEQGIM